MRKRWHVGFCDCIANGLDALKAVALGVMSRVMPHFLRVKISRGIINAGIEKYGADMTELRIDRDKKTIDAELSLAGEKESIVVHVGQYNLADDDTFTVSGLSISREWMNLVAQELVANKPKRIPAGIVKWFRMVL